MNKLIICTLALYGLLFYGCQKKGCPEDLNTKLEILVLQKFGSAYPELPKNTFVINDIRGVFSNIDRDKFQISNERFKVNNKVFSGDNFDVFKVGLNKIELAVDCQTAGSANSCNCTEAQKSAELAITILDTTQVWIKSIIYSNNFSSPRPDVYLKINNWNVKSDVSWNYSKDKDGDKIWNIDDTFSISKSDFNLSITTWDKDRIGNDEKVQDYIMPFTELQNWNQDTLRYSNGGKFKIIVQKL